MEDRRIHCTTSSTLNWLSGRAADTEREGGREGEREGWREGEGGDREGGRVDRERNRADKSSLFLSVSCKYTCRR